MFKKNLLISIVNIVITNQVVASVDENSFGGGNYKNLLVNILCLMLLKLTHFEERIEG